MGLGPALLCSADTTPKSGRSGDIKKDSPGLSPVLNVTPSRLGKRGPRFRYATDPMVWAPGTRASDASCPWDGPRHSTPVSAHREAATRGGVGPPLPYRGFSLGTQPPLRSRPGGIPHNGTVGSPIGFDEPPDPPRQEREQRHDQENPGQRAVAEGDEFHESQLCEEGAHDEE